MSEALILASVNTQYDERLFIEFLEKYKFRTCCTNIVLNVKTKAKKIQFLYTTCSEFVCFEEFKPTLGEFNTQTLVILWVVVVVVPFIFRILVQYETFLLGHKDLLL